MPHRDRAEIEKTRFERVARSMADDSEAELIARCRRGEARAWDELFTFHYPPAARFVFQLSPQLSMEDVEEICQETFLTVVKSLDGFKCQCKFQTWLFQIALNKARDYRERFQALKRGGGATLLSLDAEDPETKLSLDLPSDVPSPDACAMTAERMGLVREALDALGDPCQRIIELRSFADLSYEEISATLELNPKTVSSRLSKCLDRLEGIFRAMPREKREGFSV